MDNRDTNEIELTDSELAQVDGGILAALAGAAAFAVGVLAGYGGVRLVQDVTATGTLNAGLHKSCT
jgi:bacteriocin-like protein